MLSSFPRRSHESEQYGSSKSTENERPAGHPPDFLFDVVDNLKSAEVNGNASKSDLSSLVEQPVTMELAQPDDNVQTTETIASTDKSKVIHQEHHILFRLVVPAR